MRLLLLALLALSGIAFAPVHQTLPRGTQTFRLGWAGFQLDSALTARGARIISSGHGHVTAEDDDPAVEFVQYALANTPSASYVWKVSIAYRVPYGRAEYETLRERLVDQLGPPSDTTRGNQGDTAAHERRLTWADPFTSVQLGARLVERQDPRADRMFVTWTDRRLQKWVEVQRKKAKKK